MSVAIARHCLITLVPRSSSISDVAPWVRIERQVCSTLAPRKPRLSWSMWLKVLEWIESDMPLNVQ
jgi:hypothetical protein